MKKKESSKRFSEAKKVMGLCREIGLSTDEAQTIMLILISDDIHKIAEKLAGAK